MRGKAYTATSHPACLQVFRDKVLGYFWNRRHSQRHSSTNLVTAPLLEPLPAPRVLGPTPEA